MNNKSILSKVVVILFLVFLNINLPAQPPPPSDHGSSENTPPGGGAPIGSGIALLLVLGATYGGKKVYDFRKHKQIE